MTLTCTNADFRLLHFCRWGVVVDDIVRCRKMMATRGMLNRGETPSAQLFAISEQAEIRYTNNGLLYEVPADEVSPTPRNSENPARDAQNSWSGCVHPLRIHS